MEPDRLKTKSEVTQEESGGGIVMHDIGGGGMPYVFVVLRLTSEGSRA